MRLYMLVLFIVFEINPTVYAETFTYDGSIAASYASTYVNTAYVPNYEVSDPNNKKQAKLNPFNDYVTLGGNCTNFASQALLGGISNKSTPWKIFDVRKNYTADTEWYFKSDINRGPAWTKASLMSDYASNVSKRTKGLKFIKRREFGSKFTETDASFVGLGDLMSLKGDGKTVNHTMMVTGYTLTKCKWWDIFCKPKTTISVSYQNGQDELGNNLPIEQNLDIKTVFKRSKNEATILVYRPDKYEK